MCHDLLQGLGLSLDLLWIGLYNSNILISEATIVICVGVVEEEPRVLLLNEHANQRTSPYAQHTNADLRRQRNPDVDSGQGRKNICPSLR